MSRCSTQRDSTVVDAIGFAIGALRSTLVVSRFRVAAGSRSEIIDGLIRHSVSKKIIAEASIITLHAYLICWPHLYI